MGLVWKSKGLYVERTLVSVVETGPVPVGSCIPQARHKRLVPKLLWLSLSPVWQSWSFRKLRYLVTHHIDTGTAKPIKRQPRQTSPLKHAEIEKQVDDLLERGLMKNFNSPRSSPVVLVIKKVGTQIFFVDYREVNAVTVKDAYPLPRIGDSLFTLSGGRWFST